jgi:hypothetical protein
VKDVGGRECWRIGEEQSDEEAEHWRDVSIASALSCSSDRKPCRAVTYSAITRFPSASSAASERRTAMGAGTRQPAICAFDHIAAFQD